MGRAYIDKGKFNQPTWRKVLYVTLFASLLLMVMQKGLQRSWGFSGLVTIVMISLMYYVDFCSLLINPENDREKMHARAAVGQSRATTFLLGGF